MTGMTQILRRAFRLAASGLCLLSLLACIGAGSLWWRSSRNELRLVRTVRGVRYALSSNAGRLVLYGPPPLPSAAGTRRDVGQLVAQVRNADIRWTATLEDHWTGPVLTVTILYPGGVAPEPQTAAGMLSRRYVAADRDRLLLEALDDPARFAAAHVLLSQRTAMPGPYPEWRWAADQPRDETVGRGVYDGLTTDLRGSPDHDVVSEGHSVVGPCLARYDPSQIPALRDQWHRRLELPVCSVRHGQLAAATALPPLLWSGLRLRRRRVRRRRRRMGLCARCGYDLRGSADRCSECGEPIVVKGAG